MGGPKSEKTSGPTKDVLAQLESLGTDKVREQNTRRGGGSNQFGVPLGDLRNLAKKIKTNHELALDLWTTENIDARLLSILLCKPKSFSSGEVDQMVRSVAFIQVADWLNAYVVKRHPDKESLRLEWMRAADPMAARAGWNLTSGRIEKSPEGLDIKTLLDRIECEMGAADPMVQWTMNNCLAAIGIHVPKFRDRAVAIGEALGIYRDYPVSKGCTSPFAPIWIGEMVRRQG